MILFQPCFLVEYDTPTFDSFIPHKEISATDDSVRANNALRHSSESLAVTDNPYAAPQSESPPGAERASAEEIYSAIGGWLILVGIGVVLRPLQFGAAVVLDGVVPFMNGTWQALTTPGAPAYHSMWGIVLFYEFLMHVVLAAWSAYVAYLFFGKRKALPRAIIGFFAANAALIAIDLLLCGQIPIIREKLGNSFGASFLQQIAVCAIWIPYFRVSKRVKGTFVN